MKGACAQCPWRLANQGKRHPHSFYTRRNLQRLWNQVRGGGAKQSCHLTDPTQPDHVAVGAPLDAVAEECLGSVVLIRRELRRMMDHEGTIKDEGVLRYMVQRPQGLTRRGIIYWVIARTAFAGQPIVGGPALPAVDDDPAIGLPEWMENR